MTPSQQAVLDCIRDAIDRTGICPTFQEIADATGIRSKSGVSRHLDYLIDDGHLVRDGASQRRSLRLPSTVNLTAIPSSRLAAELARRGIRR